MKRNYVINCYPEEFKRKFAKILRQNGVLFSEYMFMVELIDDIMANCGEVHYVKLYIPRARHVAKILGNITIKYKDKSSRNSKDTIGQFLCGTLVPVNHIWFESDENKEECFHFFTHAMFGSKYCDLNGHIKGIEG